MHGVIVVPSPTPDKSMFFKDIYDFLWKVVSKVIFFIPFPVGRFFDIQINRNPKTMSRESVCPSDSSVVIGSSDVGDVSLVLFWEFLKFSDDLLKLF
jgi:hypothetical protein